MTVTSDAPQVVQPLPTSWRWERLGDVAQFINGRAFKPEDWKTSGLPIIRIENLSSDHAPFNYYDAAVEPRYIVHDGELLISWSASLDAFIWQRGEAILNQHIFKAVPHDGVVTRDYLYYVVKQAMTDIRSRVHGTTMRHITRPEFDAILIPLPPLDEQCRIVAILDEQMAAVERARTAAEQQLAAARALPASYLRAVFESDEAHAWPVAPLGELCDGTGQYGLSDKLSSEPLGIPVLRMGNLRDGGIDWSDLKYLNVSASEVSNYRLHRGDVLFNRTNSAELVGKTALFDGTREAVFASYLIRFMTRNSVLLPEFFTFYMSTQAARRFIADNLTRAIGQVNISASTMSRLSVPIPAIERQQQAVARLREGYERASRLRALVMEQLGATDHLMSAVLRAAFSGKP